MDTATVEPGVQCGGLNMAGDLEVLQPTSCSHSGKEVSADQPKPKPPKVKRKRGKRNRRMLFSRRKVRKVQKPAIQAPEVEILELQPTIQAPEVIEILESDTEADKKKPCSPTNTKKNGKDVGTSPSGFKGRKRKKSSLIGYRRKRSSIKPSIQAPQANSPPELDNDIDIETAPEVDNGHPCSSLKTKNNDEGVGTTPSVSAGGTNRLMTIKNQDSTLSVTVSKDATQPLTPHLEIPIENSIYRRIDEMIPVIVHWRNGSVPSGSTPSLLASPVYGPEVMPQFNGISVDLTDELLKQLKVSLPVSWIPIDRKVEVSAFFFASGHDTVQRAVSVHYEQGSVRISAHNGTVLPQDHAIWNEIGPNFPLCRDNVQAFSNRIARIVSAVCQLKICPGLEVTKRTTHIYETTRTLTFENNVYGDMNAPCYRPHRCSLLMSFRRSMCVTCSAMSKNFNRCEKRAAWRAASAGPTSTQNCDTRERESLPEAPRSDTRTRQDLIPATRAPPQPQLDQVPFKADQVTAALLDSLE